MKTLHILDRIDHDIPVYCTSSTVAPRQQLAVREVVQDLPNRTDPTQETRATVDHADYTAPTRQRKLPL